MSVASKNLFALLGNDEDGDEQPKAPVKTVDKTSTHTIKRNADGQAPAARAPTATGAGARRGGLSGNEAAFRDRGAGSDRNRGKTTDESFRGGARGGRGARGRGGRGARHTTDRDDRHSKGLGSSDKQAAQGWGAVEGDAEMKDEQAGEEIAQTEQKEAAAEDATAAEGGVEPEPEDTHVSFAEYEKQQREKKAQLEQENALAIRKANEGSKQDKKWAGAKPLVKEEDENYFVGSGGKAKRERGDRQQTKQLLDIDQRYVEPERARGGRGGGGRGAPRGGRGERGDFRGGRGDSRGGRGDSRGGRGEARGGRGARGDRGEFRGGRGGRGDTPVNPNDPNAFPSLGS